LGSCVRAIAKGCFVSQQALRRAIEAQGLFQLRPFWPLGGHVGLLGYRFQSVFEIQFTVWFHISRMQSLEKDDIPSYVAEREGFRSALSLFVRIEALIGLIVSYTRCRHELSLEHLLLLDDRSLWLLLSSLGRVIDIPRELDWGFPTLRRHMWDGMRRIFDEVLFMSTDNLDDLYDLTDMQRASLWQLSPMCTLNRRTAVDILHRFLLIVKPFPQ
jgi:hypothetical protein